MGVPPTAGGAKSTETHIPTGHFSMAPEDLPATDGHNRPVALRFPDGEGATGCTGMSLLHISRQEQGKHVFRNGATRRITGSQKKKQRHR